MIVLLVILLLLLCIGTGRQDATYIGKDQCNAIKGISILLVFCGHIMQYITPSGYSYSHIGDDILVPFLNFMGQLVVVMFLFYSGYGVQESIKNKGVEYVKLMPKKRLLTTLLNFDVAVFFFLILNVVLGIHHEAETIILAFIGWESIGNSNWYIFVVFMLYFVHYLNALLCNRFNIGKLKGVLGGDCPKTHKSGSANFQIVIDDNVFSTSASCSNLDSRCKTLESEVGSFRLKGKSKSKIVLGRPGGVFLQYYCSSYWKEHVITGGTIQCLLIQLECSFLTVVRNLNLSSIKDTT